MVAATVATIGAGALGIGVANAATSTSGSPSSSLVDKLVAKFGLNKADVQAVFDEERTAREAERLQNITDKLAAGVKAGTITQDQSDKILAKVKELQANREANRTKMESMTDDERKAAMEAERTAMKQWITDNNIPDEFARLVRGSHLMRVRGGDMTPPAESIGSSISN